MCLYVWLCVSHSGPWWFMQLNVYTLPYMHCDTMCQRWYIRVIVDDLQLLTFFFIITIIAIFLCVSPLLLLSIRYADVEIFMTYWLLIEWEFMRYWLMNWIDRTRGGASKAFKHFKGNRNAGAVAGVSNTTVTLFIFFLFFLFLTKSVLRTLTGTRINHNFSFNLSAILFRLYILWRIIWLLSGMLGTHSFIDRLVLLSACHSVRCLLFWTKAIPSYILFYLQILV